VVITSVLLRSMEAKAIRVSSAGIRITAV
jgi:hypothetical protein